MKRSVVIALLGLLVTAVPATAAEPLLPDLRQETPYDLGVSSDGNRHFLGFASAVYNYGDGPLRVRGSRGSTQDPAMQADQLIDQSDGSQERVERVGELRYVDALTHRHWHYLKFDTYSLLHPDGTLARSDQKTGFCLGDRTAAPGGDQLPGRHPYAEYGGHCGYDQPDLLEMEEGIAVGYGDDYDPQLEGQYIDITDLPDGRYVLVHRANADGALREKSLADNAASVLIDVRRGRSGPRVTQLARCPLSATCPVVPALSARRATQFARSAFRRTYRETARKVSCAAPADGRASCTGTLRRGATTVTVGYSVAGARVFWTYASGAHRGRVALPFPLSKRVPAQQSSPGTARTTRAAYGPLIASG